MLQNTNKSALNRYQTRLMQRPRKPITVSAILQRYFSIVKAMPRQKLIVVVIVAISGLGLLFFIHNSSTHEAKTTSSDTMGAYLSAIDTTNFSHTQRAVLNVLQQEYAKHPTSYDRTVLKYTEGFEESWCADFISWVFNQAGAPFIHLDTGYWRIPGVKTLQTYYQHYNAYREVGDYTPVFGDVAFYFGETPDGSNAEHVALVLGAKDGTLITIGGNETNTGTIQIRNDTLTAGVKGLSGFGASTI